MALHKMFHEFPTVASAETVATARAGYGTLSFALLALPFLAPTPETASKTA